MQIGDKVKHKNMFITGEIVKITDDNTAYVKCPEGTYYDSFDNWEQMESEAAVTPEATNEQPNAPVE